MEFYICKQCGNIITHLNESGVPVMCCGEPMKELISGEDGAPEKHIPLVHIDDNIVTVGMSHPMTEEHHISFVILVTSRGFRVNYLDVTEEAVTGFHLCKHETPIEVYEYCNLHGLWKTVL